MSIKKIESEITTLKEKLSAIDGEIEKKNTIIVETKEKQKEAMSRSIGKRKAPSLHDLQRKLGNHESDLLIIKQLKEEAQLQLDTATAKLNEHQAAIAAASQIKAFDDAAEAYILKFNEAAEALNYFYRKFQQIEEATNPLRMLLKLFYADPDAFAKLGIDTKKIAERFFALRIPEFTLDANRSGQVAVDLQNTLSEFTSIVVEGKRGFNPVKFLPKRDDSFIPPEMRPQVVDMMHTHVPQPIKRDEKVIEHVEIFDQNLPYRKVGVATYHEPR